MRRRASNLAHDLWLSVLSEIFACDFKRFWVRFRSFGGDGKRFVRGARTFEKGKFETVKVGRMTIGRASYEPGWKWSQHVGAASGAKFCEVKHVGLVVSGCASCQMKDGRYYEMKEGDLFYIGPGHDSWVVGNEPYVSLHFLGADHYAK